MLTRGDATADAAAVVAAVRDKVEDWFTRTWLAGFDVRAAGALYQAWLDAQAGAVVAELGGERINAILAADRRPALAALVEAEFAPQPEFDAISAVERLIRYRRDLRALLRNFVNFRDFYSPQGDAAFQSGVLYLDGRSTKLCVRVAGPNPLAAMSKAYIA